MARYTIEQLQDRAVQDVFARSPPLDDSRYGTPTKLELSAGRKVTVQFGANAINYLVPSNAAWTAGTGVIQIDKAYRILDETQGVANVREVRNPSELESVAFGYLEEIQKILKRSK